jgi:hypothetical protein
MEVCLKPRLPCPGTHWTGGSVGPTTVWTLRMRKILLCRESKPDRPVHSLTTKLNYLGSRTRMESLGKTEKSQTSRSPGQDSNRIPSEYKTQAA